MVVGIIQTIIVAGASDRGRQLIATQWLATDSN